MRQWDLSPAQDTVTPRDGGYTVNLERETPASDAETQTPQVSVQQLTRILELLTPDPDVATPVNTRPCVLIADSLQFKRNVIGHVTRGGGILALSPEYALRFVCENDKYVHIELLRYAAHEIARTQKWQPVKEVKKTVYKERAEPKPKKEPKKEPVPIEIDSGITEHGDIF